MGAAFSSHLLFALQCPVCAFGRLAHESLLLWAGELFGAWVLGSRELKHLGSL